MLADWRSAPVAEPLRATLGFLERLTLTPREVGSEDVARVRAAGVRDEAIRDAVYVCAAFCLIDRIADSLAFEVLTPERYAERAGVLLASGYAWHPALS